MGHFYVGENESEVISKAVSRTSEEEKKWIVDTVQLIPGTLGQKILHARSHAFEAWRISYDSFITSDH